MGCPRASSIRQIRSGERCSICETYIGKDPEYKWGERCSDKCGTITTFQAYFVIIRKGTGWLVRPVEAGGMYYMREFTFGSATKIVELALKTGALKTADDRRALDVDIAKGTGGFWTRLTEEQCAGVMLRKK